MKLWVVIVSFLIVFVCVLVVGFTSLAWLAKSGLLAQNKPEVCQIIYLNDGEDVRIQPGKSVCDPVSQLELENQAKSSVVLTKDFDLWLTSRGDSGGEKIKIVFVEAEVKPSGLGRPPVFAKNGLATFYAPKNSWANFWVLTALNYHNFSGNEDHNLRLAESAAWAWDSALRGRDYEAYLAVNPLFIKVDEDYYNQLLALVKAGLLPPVIWLEK